MDIRRGQIIGKRLGEPSTDEAEHFIQCAACDGWIDMRNLGQVFEHAGPLPHPAQDRTN
jgi:CRISPR/Cas system type I-B associated protein Csh2 (Cas7 group RAMP superfamily)